MKEYTSETKAGLEERYRKCDEAGIYFAHQPIYGFRKGHSERGLIARYLRTYQLIKSLSYLEFTSLLDAGCAEGFQGYMIERIFGTDVRGCDLSEEACRRAGEIFGLEADPADIHNLPYDDGRFDVVVCSETLEHMVDHVKAIRELLRVASKAVVVTVPHEPVRKIKKNIELKIPHGHIHNFSSKSFEFLKGEGYQVYGRRFISRLLAVPEALLEATPMQEEEHAYPDWLLAAYNRYVSISDRFISDSVRKRIVAMLLPGDEALCRFVPCYGGLVFIILKGGAHAYGEKRRSFAAREIIDASVPLYRLGEER
ncbi:MAG: class I SAM-dependent methyltransferase [Actinobacteria bacterium]|jgi:SAM-dependent methyltransferase|nr:MAG: class I SAM-dependent methyltransferase [Actinomycetota bacterium]